MELKLKKEENVKLMYNDCPRCHNPFNSTTRKKTDNHAIPKFLKPKTEITHTLCLKCHKELNGYYITSKLQLISSKKSSSTFEEFEKTYEQLKEDYHNKKIHRGQFGEGLWTNLVSYLGSIKKK